MSEYWCVVVWDNRKKVWTEMFNTERDTKADAEHMLERYKDPKWGRGYAKRKLRVAKKSVLYEVEDRK